MTAQFTHLTESIPYLSMCISASVCDMLNALETLKFDAYIYIKISQLFSIDICRMYL